MYIDSTSLTYRNCPYIRPITISNTTKQMDVTSAETKELPISLYKRTMMTMISTGPMMRKGRHKMPW